MARDTEAPLRRFGSASGERGGNRLNGFHDCRTENGSSQGQILALTAFCVPRSLDSSSDGCSSSGKCSDSAEMKGCSTYMYQLECGYQSS